MIGKIILALIALALVSALTIDGKPVAAKSGPRYMVAVL
jgi:hypothetical protein